MRILVVGATGFIGTEFVKSARIEGHEVFGCGRSPWGEKTALLFPCREDYWSMEDGQIPSQIWKQIDAVVLLASKRPYKGFNYEDYKENVNTAEKLMEEAVTYGITNFVFASSKAVYSGPDMPWKENTACIPSSLYGASKLAAEQLGLYFNNQGMLHFKSLRFAQVIGLGERKGYLINTLIDNAREKKAQTVFGTGKQRRQYVYIKDVCKAIMTAINKPMAEGTFNIGIPGNTSNLELAVAVNTAFSNEGNLTHDFSHEMFGTDDEMDVTKARELLGFHAEYGIMETFADLAKLYDCNDIH